MNTEFGPKLTFASLALITGLSSVALTGCSNEETPIYDGYMGCNQATIIGGPADVEPSIDDRISELNDKKEAKHGALKNTDTYFAKDTNKDTMDAIFDVYEVVYGTRKIALQAGTKISFCVSDIGKKSYSLAGKITVKDKDYVYLGGQWQPR